MMSTSGVRPGPSPVARAFCLLTCFSETTPRLSLTALAARTGLPLSTTHRLATQLVGLGALSREADGRYAVGRSLWQVGLAATVERDLRQVAAPFLSDLFAATGATVHLAVRQGAEVLYLDRLSGRRSVPVVSRVGSRLPLHATGVGKVLLAHAPADVHAEAFRRLTPITAHTVTSPVRLEAQLALIRERGHATTLEEMTPGACSVAVPVWHADEVVAALGAVVSTTHWDAGHHASALRVAAVGIGRSLAR